MSIDIKATRGEGGMTAEIELSENVKAMVDKIPAVPVNRTQLGQAVATPVVQAPVGITRLVPKGAASVPATQVPVASATAASGSGMTVEADSVNKIVEAEISKPDLVAPIQSDTAGAQDPVVVQSLGGPVEEPAKKAPVGLFANLKKPINTPALL